MVAEASLAQAETDFDWAEFLQRWIRPLDYHFACFIEEKNGQPCIELWLAAALASWRLGQGHVCFDLHCFDPASWFGPAAEQLPWPSIEQWALTLARQPMVSKERAGAPLVLQQGRLYLERYWQFEATLSDGLLSRTESLSVEPDAVSSVLERLFPGPQSGASAHPVTMDLFEPAPAIISTEPDWQKIACALAVRQRFVVISGGPGTGKTTTVVKLLALLLELAADKPPVIKLAAPTGKAAARLSESIAGAVGRVELREDLRELMPQRATTIHRLLGARRDSIEFRHNRDNPLHLDILVVDEASMVDLPLMARLISALPERARLVLLGDKDQLASVEAGSVLGDICAGAQSAGYTKELAAFLAMQTGVDQSLLYQPNTPAIADSLALLRKSYRFDQNSGIGELARAVNTGDAEGARQIFEKGFKDLALFGLDQQAYQQLLDQAVAGYREYLERLASGAPDSAVLQAFNQFQLLCALREGDFGVEGVNRRVEQALVNSGLIPGNTKEWYAGRPIIITRNDKALGLSNGDVGICIKDSEGRLRVAFDLGAGEIIYHLPSRLPAYETVFAMTVHRSQGSEFDRVLLLLPPKTNPVITRELIYTGITRAKQQLALYAYWPVVIDGVCKKTQRDSGLAMRLWGRDFKSK